MIAIRFESAFVCRRALTTTPAQARDCAAEVHELKAENAALRAAIVAMKTKVKATISATIEAHVQDL